MPDLGPYTLYIFGAYAITTLGIGALLAQTLFDLRVTKRKLDEIGKS